MSARAVDLFAGPGGWDVAAADLGLTVVGIEHDAAACTTRAAAGHLTIRADVARYAPERFAGWDGIIGSPPCPTFSSAGLGAGVAVLHVIEQAVRDEFAGRRRLARHTRTMAHLLRTERYATLKVRRADASAWAWRQARMSALVVQPARWLLAIKPRWIALEQVPAVLPIWRVYAELLRGLGYSVWAGVLNAADYGVPQTRKRAILTASLDRAVTAPEPTHDRDPVPTLFGELERWVSMAEALGWGATARPCPSVTAGGTKTGGAEPIAKGGRIALERERERTVRGSHGASGQREPTCDDRACDDDHRGGGQRELPVGYRRVRGTGMIERHGERADTPADEPAPTITSKARSDVWVVDRRTNSKAAGWRNGGGMVPTVPVAMDRPAPTFTSKAGHQWCFTRPATTLVASFCPDVIAAPGYRTAGSGPRQNAEGSIKISVGDALILQSFDPDYPVQGPRTKQFEQIGNAIPPRLAWHVLGTVLP